MAARKKKIVRRARSGLAAVQADKGFDHVLYAFHYELDKKTLASICKDYVKKTYSKTDAAAILANPEWNWTAYSYIAATIWYVDNEGTFTPTQQCYHDRLDDRIRSLIEPGKKIIADKKADQKKKDNVIVLTPQERLRIKINNTIMSDLDDLEDAWIAGEKPEFDMYQQFLKHGLSNQAVDPVRKVLDGWLLDYSDAYHKRCEQAVEGYSHLKRPEIKRRMKHCEAMLADLEKVKSAAKARRKTRAPKVRTADKQVAKMQYLKEDKNFKLVSVAATSIPGGERLYTFNTKNKVLTEYVTNNRQGFEVSGSTLKNVDQGVSRQVTLRKPDEFLPIVQNKSTAQIDKAWKTLTTKTRTPAPRINKDTILVRVL